VKRAPCSQFASLNAGDVLQFEQLRHGCPRSYRSRTAGNVVDDDRDSDRVIDRLEVLVQAFLGRLVVVMASPPDGAGAGFSACSASSMASLVELEPAPAITGTRPPASLMHHSTTRLCSSWFTVGLSPVVPTGTRPWVPSAICQPYQPAKGRLVERAVLERRDQSGEGTRKFVLAAMDFLPERTPPAI